MTSIPTILFILATFVRLIQTNVVVKQQMQLIEEVLSHHDLGKAAVVKENARKFVCEIVENEGTEMESIGKSGHDSNVKLFELAKEMCKIEGGFQGIINCFHEINKLKKLRSTLAEFFGQKELPIVNHQNLVNEKSSNKKGDHNQQTAPPRLVEAFKKAFTGVEHQEHGVKLTIWIHGIGEQLRDMTNPRVAFAKFKELWQIIDGENDDGMKGKISSQGSGRTMPKHKGIPNFVGPHVQPIAVARRRKKRGLGDLFGNFKVYCAMLIFFLIYLMRHFPPYSVILCAAMFLIATNMELLMNEPEVGHEQQHGNNNYGNGNSHFGASTSGQGGGQNSYGSDGFNDGQHGNNDGDGYKTFGASTSGQGEGGQGGGESSAHNDGGINGGKEKEKKPEKEKSKKEKKTD